VSPAKLAEAIDMPLGMLNQVGPRNHVLDGSHWRNLANTIELPMCGGDAAIPSSYFDHL